MFSFSFRYSAPFLRRHYVAELWRRQGGFLIAIPIAVALVVVFARSPDFQWISGFLGGLITTYVLLIYSLYRQYVREMANRLVHATVSESGLEFDVESVASLAPWAQIRSVRGTPYALILTLRWRTRPILLPKEVASPDVSSFIAREVRAAGGTVTDSD